MEIAQFGVIVFVDHYEACIGFYRDAIGLPIIFDLPDLTFFAVGDAYLEIERGGPPAVGRKRRHENPVVLRFDVIDLPAAVAQVNAAGFITEYLKFDWGEIAVVLDPDGNRCKLKRHDPTQTGLLS